MADKRVFEVNNMDIQAVVRYCKRFQYDTVKAVSANLQMVTEADKVRQLQYLDVIESKLDTIMAQPQLDLPEWTPEILDLGTLNELPVPENEALVTQAKYYDIMIVELCDSQSARMGTGLIAPDIERVRKILARMRMHVNAFIMVTQPIDVPESSPMRLSTGAGRTGI